MEKPDCYKCEHREKVAGSCHSKCLHPAFKKLQDDPMIRIAGLMGGIPQIKSSECIVEGYPQGIRSGWFGHPLNFDPTCL